MSRPNILWLVSEDNSPEFVEPYGRLARTPTLAQLAAGGVVYENAFATAPVCAPSRFSIITGRYASSHAPACHMRSGDQGSLPDGVRQGLPAHLREAGYYCTNNAKEDYNAPIDVADTWDESSPTAHWRDRPDGAPFFAVFNYATTHERFVHPGIAEPLPDGTRPEDVVLPKYQPDLPELRRDRALYFDQNTRLDGELAERLAELEADGLAEDTIVLFYGDHGGVTPRTKRFCYDSGLRVPLIVHVPHKWQHLWPHGPGSRVGDVVTLMDLGPTALSLAGVPVPDGIHGRPIAGPQCESPALYAYGMRNRMDERYDLVRTVRDSRYRYIRNYMPHLPAGQHMTYLFRQPGVRVWQDEFTAGRLNDEQSAFWRARPFEELYDIRSDPDEVHNLSESPEHAPLLDRLRTALDRHLLRTRDTGFIPEGSQLEHPEASTGDDAYPLDRVMDIAATAARREPASLPSLVAALDDDAEPIRYWGALGILMLGNSATERPVSALESRLIDPSPSVRIVAAEALGQLETLADLTTCHDNPRIRLQAINAIDRLMDTVPEDADHSPGSDGTRATEGAIEPSGSDAARSALLDDNTYVRWVAEHVVNRTDRHDK